jgi:hypothetical protein
MAGLSQGSDTNFDQASKLNDAWTTLGATYDQYYDRLATKTRDVIRTALSSWQDFYYGSDTWPADQLTRWSTVFTTAAQILKAAIPAGAVPSTDFNKASNTYASPSDAIFTITGKAPGGGIGFAKIPWWWWALGLLPVYYLTRKRDYL